MKKKRFLLVLSLLSLACTSCTILMPWQNYNSGTSTEEETEKLVGKKQVFLDSSFEKGFLAIPGGGTQIKTGFVPDDRYAQNVVLKYGSNTNQPVWTLRQNNDVYNLNDKYCENNTPDYADGYYIFSDPSKKLMVSPSTSSLYMELDSSIEYGGENERETSDTWAHMLIASSLSHQVKVGNLQSLSLSLNIQLMKNIDLSINKNYANEMILYLQLSNSNQDETAKADKPIWFGIPFFNSDSNAFNQEYAAVDTAQGANSGGFIYKFAMDKLYKTYETSLVDYSKHSIEIELIQYFEVALKKAQDKGYWTSSTINDLVIGDMDFGFELPGRRKLGVQFSNLKLTADYGE